MASSATYLDQTGLTTLTTEIFKNVNKRFAEVSAATVNTGDTTHFPNSDAVYKFVNETVNNKIHLKFEVVTGEITTTVQSPETNVIYLQRDSDSDNTYVMYVYQDSKWISIGDTTFDSSNFWSKTETSTLKEQLEIPQISSLEEQTIKSAVEAAYNSTTINGGAG